MNVKTAEQAGVTTTDAKTGKKPTKKVLQARAAHLKSIEGKSKGATATETKK
jgi:hypothetical protein